MPYDAGSWAGMEQALDKAMPVGGAASGGSSWGSYAAGGALLIAGGIALFTMWPTEDNIVADDQVLPVVEEAMPATNESDAALTIDSQKPQAQEEVAEVGEAGENETPEEILAVEVEEPTTGEMAAASEADQPNNATKEEERKEVRMDVEPTFMMSFIPSSTKVCEGESVSFLNTATETNAVYTWDFGDGTTINSKDAEHVFTNAGSYAVKLTGKKKGSDKEITQRITVDVLPKPSATFTVEPNPQSAHLVSVSTSLVNGQKAEWSFSDMKGQQLGSSTQHLFRGRGEYNITLTVVNGFGCTAKASESYSVPNDLPMERFAANTFTPDGDGTNDRFYIPTIRLLDVPFTMTITDQLGRVVFQTSDKNASWDGIDQNTGQPVPNGPCGWQINIDKNYLDSNTFTGSVQLKRN